MNRLASRLLITPKIRLTSTRSVVRRLVAFVRSPRNTKRLISLATALILLFASVPSLPQQMAGKHLRVQFAIHRDNGWFSNASIGRPFLSMVNWLSERLRSKAAGSLRSAPPVTAYISPLPPVLNAPSNLNVTTASNSSLSLSWTAPTGAVDHYQIERSTHVNGPFLLQGSAGTTTYTDSAVSAGTSYLYRVRAIGSDGSFSSPSNMALGTAFSFEFSSLQGQLIKAQHIYDLRTTINAARAAGNLSGASWVITDLSGALVQASVVQELRNKLDEALQALSISAGAYTEPTLATGSNGTLVKAIHLEELQTRSTRGSSSSSGPVTDINTARLDPLNQTGGGAENPLSRNYNWNLPLLSLPGRAGLDLGLTLSYNSLVWTKSGNSISFDNDSGFPSPGFRLGFPTIQNSYINSETAKWSYLLIGSDGSHTELRQVASNSVLFESADSSDVLLDTTGLTSGDPKMALRTTDGTQLTYKPKGTAYECTEIKDRNGNYITINYNSSGRMANIHDTLDRVISFNYDTSNNLTSITQGWTVNGQAQTHNWAVFAYRNPDLTIQTNFPGLTVLGPSTIKPLEKVTLSDGSVFNFDYTSWGQVRKISNVASDGLTLLNYRSYNLPIDASSSASDCPRFTERHDWAAYWNGDTDATASTSEEAVTTYDILWNQTWTMPDNTSASGTVAQVGLKLNPTTYVSYDKIYFIGTAGNTTNGWQRGLPSLVRTYDEANGLQRQVQTTWVQDSGASYIINPRVAETNIYDSANNRKRTSISYQTATFNDGTSYRLPQDVYEYQADASTVLRRSHTDYNLATSYRTQWIIGCRVNRCFTK